MSDLMADVALPPVRSRLYAEELMQAEQGRLLLVHTSLTWSGGAVRPSSSMHALSPQLRCRDLGLGLRHSFWIPIPTCLLIDQEVRWDLAMSMRDVLSAQHASRFACPCRSYDTQAVLDIGTGRGRLLRLVRGLQPQPR